MKVELENVALAEDEGALIRAVKVTEDIQNAIDMLSESCRVIPVTKKATNSEYDDGTFTRENVMCPTDKIYYAESVDKRTYVYTKDDCYESSYRLYELENILNQNFFIQGSFIWGRVGILADVDFCSS